jgi:hypothetical protein
MIGAEGLARRDSQFQTKCASQAEIRHSSWPAAALARAIVANLPHRT